MTKDIKFEDLANMKCGDQIIIEDPLKRDDVPYVLMSKIEDRPDYYFVSSYGASFMIKDQKTIDGFGVRVIDDTHPSWDADLSEKGKEMGKMLDQFKVLDEMKEA